MYQTSVRFKQTVIISADFWPDNVNSNIGKKLKQNGRRAPVLSIKTCFLYSLENGKLTYPFKAFVYDYPSFVTGTQIGTKQAFCFRLSSLFPSSVERETAGMPRKSYIPSSRRLDHATPMSKLEPRRAMFYFLAPLQTTLVTGLGGVTSKSASSGDDDDEEPE